MAIITLKGWYQLDFSLPSAGEAKKVLLSIDAVMTDMKSSKLVDLWFFLFEGDTIRVRIKSKDKVGLKKGLDRLAMTHNLTPSDKLSFSEYQENDETMFNETVAGSFAKIMSEVTILTIGKLKSELDFDNYRVLERLQHCMFNVLLTLGFKNEEHFLINRLHERIGKPSDKDFENKI